MVVNFMTLINYVLPFFIGLLAVLVLKESFNPVMMTGALIILVSTIVVRFTKVRFWPGAAGNRVRYFEVQPPSTGSVTPVT
jgi:drug/metabolite transporter (DMT)-like permease